MQAAAMCCFECSERRISAALPGSWNATEAVVWSATMAASASRSRTSSRRPRSHSATSSPPPASSSALAVAAITMASSLPRIFSRAMPSKGLLHVGHGQQLAAHLQLARAQRPPRHLQPDPPAAQLEAHHAAAVEEVLLLADREHQGGAHGRQLAGEGGGALVGQG